MAGKQRADMGGGTGSPQGMGADKQRHSTTVAYVPTILRSMAEICEAMGVGPKTVKGWVEKGAPIAVEGDGGNTRYSAEMARLQAWREVSCFSTEQDYRECFLSQGQ